jgi:hypothetical protein
LNNFWQIQIQNNKKYAADNYGTNS